MADAQTVCILNAPRKAVSPRTDMSSAKSVCVLACYLLIISGSLALSFYALGKMELRQLRAIHLSYLLYTSQDRSAAALAKSINNRFHIRIIDLLAPGSGDEVFRLTGSRNATSPSLVLPVDHGSEIASGWWAVRQSLLPLESASAPIESAKHALAIMAVLLLLALLFESEFCKFVSFLPMVGLVAISAL